MPDHQEFALAKRLTQALLGSLVAAAVMAAPPDGVTDDPTLGYSSANMDKRASPRKDFYRYAAGQWLERTPIPASEAEVGGFTQLSINLDRQLLKLINDSVAAKGAPGSPRQQIGDYWLAAMDVKRLDEVGLKPLQADLDRVAALPLPGASVALGELSGRLQMAYGVSPLVNMAIATDAKNSKAKLLMASAARGA